jgi:hypothetical protein
MLREATYPPAAVNVLDVSSEKYGRFSGVLIWPLLGDH